MVDTSSAFLYPYTSVDPHDLDAVVAAALLYDQVYYLSYWESRTRDPLLEGILRWEGDEYDDDTRREMGAKTKKILRKFRSAGVLRPLTYESFQPYISNKRKETAKVEQITAERYQEIHDILKNEGFADRAKREGKEKVAIASDKFIRSRYLSKLPLRGQPVDIDETLLDWSEGISLLIMYANWASAVENHSPFAFDKLHADALNSVLLQRARDPKFITVAEHQLDSPLKHAFFGEFMELALPNLRNCHELSSQKLLAIRENTHELRKKFLEGLSKIYSEYIEDLEPTKYGQAIIITEELLPKIAEYKAELQNFTTDESTLTSVKGEFFGFFAEVASLGTAHLCLPDVIDPLSMALTVGVSGISVLAKTLYQYKKKPTFTVDGPLSSTVLYMEELKNI